MSSIPFTSFVDFYKLYRRIFRMSYCGAECDLIEDKTIEQYNNYFINGEFKKSIEEIAKREMFICKEEKEQLTILNEITIICSSISPITPSQIKK